MPTASAPRRSVCANTDHTQWNFAWALHAGVAYNVSQNFKMELAYRYLNMGSVDTAEVLCGATGCGTGAGPRAFYTLRDMTSHDIKLGFRWLLQPERAAAGVHAAAGAQGLIKRFTSI